jgi:spore photoproduct lyase
MIPFFERLIIDRRALGDPATDRIRDRLAGVEEIVTDDVGSHTGRSALVLKYHAGRFVKDFPVTPGAPPCGEQYIAALQGCLYDCSYCYLKSYLSLGAITMLVNSEKMENDIMEALDSGTVRLTTGELSDSLAIDHITGLTSAILPLLDGTSAVIEARTKSANVGHLPGVNGRDRELAARNLLVTWTLAPPQAITSEESLAAPLDERLGAISKVASAGIGFALRLDPIIPHYWDAVSYRGLLERVKGAAGEAPRRIELGVLRFPPGLTETVRRDLPYSLMLRGEYVRDGEGKMRLYRPMRIRLYRDAAKMIGEVFPGTLVELSQEDRTVWEDAGLEPPAAC